MRANKLLEFSRSYAVENLPLHRLQLHLEATRDECKAIAKRAELIDLKSLKADLDMGWLPGSKVLEIKGRIDADLVQRCVLTLEEFPSKTTYEFTTTFQDGGTIEQSVEETVDLGHEIHDEPEFLVDGRVDLGELVTQQMILNLDPYPKKPGAKLAVGAGEGKVTPFAELKSLLKK
jgi:hypothetical protein